MTAMSSTVSAHTPEAAAPPVVTLVPFDRTEAAFVVHLKDRVRHGDTLYIEYTNHRGETAVRRVEPRNLRYGRSAFHTGCQWFLEAYDAERAAERSFAVLDISRISPEE